MPLSKRLTTYRDVESVFATAVTSAGGCLKFPSHKIARAFYRRMHKYRTLLDGAKPDYDNFRLSLDDNMITILLTKFAGQFEDPAGNVVVVEEEEPPVEPEPPVDPDIQDRVRSLNRSIGLRSEK